MMKHRLALVALLVAGLVAGGALSAYAVAPDFTLSANVDAANTLKANQKNAVIGSFKVTGDAAANTITAFQIDGGLGGAVTTLVAAEIDRIAVYEDININGTYEAGADVLIGAVSGTGGAADVDEFLANGTNAVITPAAPIAFAASEVRYYLVVIDVNKTVADGKIADSGITIVEGDAETHAINAAGGWADDTVDVVATHLQWDAAGYNAQVATNGNAAAQGGAVILRAVDDYGNTDTGYATTVQFTSENYLTGASTVGTLTATVNGADATVGAGASAALAAGLVQTAAAVAGDVTAIQNTVAGAVTVIAVDANGLDGSVTYCNEAYPANAQVSIHRGVEFYDTDHNGHLDRCTVFMDKPIVLGGTGNNAFPLPATR